MSNIKDAQLHDTSGSVLVTVTLAMIAMIGLMGLAIDSYLASTSRTQYQAVADATALAALEAYWETFDPNNAAISTVPATISAYSRAAEVAQARLGTLVTKNLFENPLDQRMYLQIINTGSAGRNGWLLPGVLVRNLSDSWIYL